MKKKLFLIVALFLMVCTFSLFASKDAYAKKDRDDPGPIGFNYSISSSINA